MASTENMQSVVQDNSTSLVSIERMLLKEILWLRKCEEYLVKVYHEQEMRTPCHFATGQEAIAAGVCKALQVTDAVYSHHRCHNHYLAMGGTFYGLAAELYGRVGGCSRGRGGSVHLTSRSTGFIVSSAILGESIAVATGSAFAFKINKQPHIGVAFFGDASCEEGSFYESLNFASINKLPALFICENNLYSTESHIDIRQANGTHIRDRATALGIEAHVVDGNDVFAVYNAVKKALPKLRSGTGPIFLECMTYRWREHVGPNFDFNVANRDYRSKEEQEYWINEKCPVKHAIAKLLQEKKITEQEVEQWQQEMDENILTTIAQVKASPWPNTDELLLNVY